MKIENIEEAQELVSKYKQLKQAIKCFEGIPISELDLIIVHQTLEQDRQIFRSSVFWDEQVRDTLLPREIVNLILKTLSNRLAEIDAEIEKL